MFRTIDNPRAPPKFRDIGESIENTRARYILVFDKDRDARRVVLSYLEENDYATKAISAPDEIYRSLAIGMPRLLILDTSQNQEGGFEMLAKIRSTSDIPIIITSSNHYRESDCVVGLELGADDCMPKPYSLRELLARVRAVLRREVGRSARSRDPERGGYRFGGWQLERRGRRLFDSTGRPVPLTKGQYSLLLAFLNAPHQPLTREQLLNATRVHEDVFDRSIDVQILRLRRKFETNSGVPNLIRTERGIGYVFSLPVERF